MGFEKDTYKIEKFNGTNFSFWKMQMEDYLYQDLYLSIVEKPKDMSDEEWVVERKPGGMTDAQWMVLDWKALGASRLSLLKSVAFIIKGQETATDLMKALSNLYEQPSAARKVHLIKKLVNLKMSENQSFKEHLNVFNEVTDGLNSVSIIFDDEVLASIILGQMPESWSMTCQSIANSFGKEKLTFQQVVDMIMTQEIRMCEEGSGLVVTYAQLDSNIRVLYVFFVI
jgi:hypothetical protein